MEQTEQQQAAQEKAIENGQPNIFSSPSKQFEEDNQRLQAGNSNENPYPEQIVASTNVNELKHERPMMTAAQIDTHLEAGKPVIQAALLPQLANPSIAAVYQLARPVLQLVEGILFFKPSWATAIKILIGALDAAYPTALN